MYRIDSGVDNSGDLVSRDRDAAGAECRDDSAALTNPSYRPGHRLVHFPGARIDYAVNRLSPATTCRCSSPVLSFTVAAILDPKPSVSAAAAAAAAALKTQSVFNRPSPRWANFSVAVQFPGSRLDSSRIRPVLQTS